MMLVFDVFHTMFSSNEGRNIKEKLVKKIAEIRAANVTESDLAELENTSMNNLLEQIINKLSENPKK